MFLNSKDYCIIKTMDPQTLPIYNPHICLKQNIKFFSKFFIKPELDKKYSFWPDLYLLRGNP